VEGNVSHKLVYRVEEKLNAIYRYNSINSDFQAGKVPLDLADQFVGWVKRSETQHPNEKAPNK
jgi:hypothetical protein